MFKEVTQQEQEWVSEEMFFMFINSNLSFWLSQAKFKIVYCLVLHGNGYFLEDAGAEQCYFQLGT